MPRAEAVHRDGGPGRKQLPDKQGNPVGAPQAAAFGELKGQPGAGNPLFPGHAYEAVGKIRRGHLLHLQNAQHRAGYRLLRVHPHRHIHIEPVVLVDGLLYTAE